MKRQEKKSCILAGIAIAALVVTGCAGDRKETTAAPLPEQSDSEFVQAKGKLVVGVTDFAPMDYHDGEAWAGFDADLAKAFAESIGVTAELTEIDWDEKTKLLEKGNIDCIWNGMTVTEELQETISCSEPYLSNAQVIVLPDDDAGQYQTADDCQHMLFAVEAGSTGESLLKEKKYRYTPYATQLEALQSVREKKADAAVIDIIMAEYYTGDGQEFEDLQFNIALNDEKFCVGFRKDSDLTQQVNAFLKSAYEDGTINALAEEYGVKNAVLD